MAETLKSTFLDSITEIDAQSWDDLFPGSNPFIRHAFLQALENSGSVCAETGWEPRHLVLEQAGRVVAAMPLYLKSHSYGEFVFDWSWAQAYEQQGLDYYPKLLTAIPFTPSRGPRIGVAQGQAPAMLVDSMLAALVALAHRRELSGWHLLFPDQSSEDLLPNAVDDAPLLRRSDVQFHWRNRDYESFAGYLSALKSSRRKSLKRERRLVADQGVSLRRRVGREIGDEDWRSFYLCYVATYLKRSGHGGYLTQDFFKELSLAMPENLMMVVARRDGQAVASALFLHDEQTLYGRYWGALEDVHCLHFEACFYQGIEFCIERNLAIFDPGTQGEHKLLRGFEPVTTHSFHWIADVRFRAAIAEYLRREGRVSEAFGNRAAEFLPFKKE